MNIVYEIILQALLLLPVALGCYLSFYVLRIVDLTTDGSFVLGAGVFAVLVRSQVNVWLAMLLASLAGGVMGFIVGFLQKDGRIDPTIAGILGLFTLQSLNIVIMGRPNLSLLSVPNLSSFSLAIFAIIIFILVGLVLHSRNGLLLTALGENALLLKNLNFRVNLIKCLGLAFSNFLSASSGVLSAQNFGYADINLGVGVTIIGVGSMMLGILFRTLFGINQKFYHFLNLFCIFIGVSTYFFFLTFLLKIGINPIYLKLFLGVLISSLFFFKSSERL